MCRCNCTCTTPSSSTWNMCTRNGGSSRSVGSNSGRLPNMEKTYGKCKISTRGLCKNRSGEP
uniref:Uncharacterized protein n=1 Tax=Arundo donax TaxID=35708 RepID=A0A0A9AZA8_ARUDO